MTCVGPFFYLQSGVRQKVFGPKMLVSRDVKFWNRSFAWWLVVLTVYITEDYTSEILKNWDLKKAQVWVRHFLSGVIRLIKTYEDFLRIFYYFTYYFVSSAYTLKEIDSIYLDFEKKIFRFVWYGRGTNFILSLIRSWESKRKKESNLRRPISAYPNKRCFYFFPLQFGT